MATWEDVRGLALALPEVVERSPLDWRIRDKMLAWERPLRRADVKVLGVAAPDGDVLAVWVPDLGVKEALLAAEPQVYFTTPHFDGYKAVLVRLAEIDADELREILTEAWLDRAPKRLARTYLETRS